MYKRIHQILETLSSGAGEYYTASELAQELGVGEKTVRNLIRDINDVISKCGAGVRSRYGKGYYLDIVDSEAWETFRKSSSAFLGEAVPSNSQERGQFILEYLFNNPGYVKMDELSGLLYVSKRTLTTDLKEVERFLNRFGVRLIRRPNYGIRIEGSEFCSRLCIASFSQNRFGKSNQTMDEIGTCLLRVFAEKNFQIPDVSFQNLVVHLYIAVSRIMERRCIPMPEQDLTDPAVTGVMDVARAVADEMEARFGVTFPEGEILYIGVHLAGKTGGAVRNGASAPNMVIPAEISALAARIMERVYETCGQDFRQDLELLMVLSQHLVPMRIRIRYGMDLKNPMLRDIKKKFCFAYTAADAAAAVINEHYNTELSEDEISYLAIAFALAAERRDGERPKKNVLFVCGSGQVSARLLAYKYGKRFGGCLNRVAVVDAAALAAADLSGYDYIFSCVPIPHRVSIPVLEFDSF